MIVAFDCEGPITISDAAAEACMKFIEQGSSVYPVLSRGVFLILEDSKHKAWWDYKLQTGTTLALLAFLLAARNVTEEELREISLKRGESCLIPGIKKLFSNLQAKGHRPLIITTSYSWDATVIAKALNVTTEELFCTQLHERFTLSDIRSKKMSKNDIGIAEWFIGQASKIHCPELSSGVQDKKIRNLMDMLINQLSSTSAGRLFKQVDIMGGIGKPNSLQKAVLEKHGEFNNVLFVGDSSTDIGVANLMTDYRRRRKNTVFIAWNGTKEIVTPQATWGIAGINALAMEPVINAWLEGGIEAGNAFIKEVPVAREIKAPRYNILYRMRPDSLRLRSIQNHHLQVRRAVRGYYTANLI